MISFRPHHLVCLQFFSGEGYTPEFVEALSELLVRAESERVRVVSGLDDLCVFCPYVEGGICKYEDEVKELDSGALALLGVKIGDVVTFSDVRGVLPRIVGIWRDRFCASCTWADVCGKNELYRSALRSSGGGNEDE